MLQSCRNQEPIKALPLQKAGEPGKVYPNLLMAEMQIDGPMQCIVSDMTAFYIKGVYCKWMLYMDLWNNEMVRPAFVDEGRCFSSQKGTANNPKGADEILAGRCLLACMNQQLLQRFDNQWPVEVTNDVNTATILLFNTDHVSGCGCVHPGFRLLAEIMRG